ncbi:MAG: hypothetical protein ABEN55_13705, partial [Bradymonadaceae bacterium]
VVGVSITDAYGDDSARSILETLRDDLPAEVDLLAGGNGAPDDIERVIRLTDLEKLYDWAAERTQAAPAT